MFEGSSLWKHTNLGEVSVSRILGDSIEGWNAGYVRKWICEVEIITFRLGGVVEIFRYMIWAIIELSP